MRISGNYSDQSFGSLIVNPSAMKVIKKRLADTRELQEFEKLTRSQYGNMFDAKITVKPGTDKLQAKIAQGTAFSETLKEGFLARLFSSPIKFIRKVCKKADEIKAMDDNFTRLRRIYDSQIKK